MSSHHARFICIPRLQPYYGLRYRGVRTSGLGRCRCLRSVCDQTERLSPCCGRAAITVLKADQIVMSKPAGGPKPKAPGGQDNDD